MLVARGKGAASADDLGERIFVGGYNQRGAVDKCPEQQNVALIVDERSRVVVGNNLVFKLRRQHNRIWC